VLVRVNSKVAEVIFIERTFRNLEAGRVYKCENGNGHVSVLVASQSIVEWIETAQNRELTRARSSFLKIEIHSLTRDPFVDSQGLP
jgi:hypothetical protein